MRARFVIVIAAIGSLGAGCGGDSGSSIPLLPMETRAEQPIDRAPAPNVVVTTTEPVATTETATTTTLAPPEPWVPITANLSGLPSECGNLSWLAVRPDRDMVIAGVALQGLFAQFDGADEWVALGASEGSATIRHRMTSVVFDPEQPERFWETGIYGGNGVYRTDDNGATFEQLGEIEHIDLVSVDFTDPERRTLLAGTHEQPVVLRSGDGGATWQDVSASLPEGIGNAAYPHVIDAQIHLLGTNIGPAAGVYRTSDAGETWSLVRPGGVFGAPLVVDGTIWWLTEFGGGVISSSDGGETWSEMSAAGQISRNASSLVALPGGRIATIGQGYVIESADGGETWSRRGSPLPYEPTGMAYSPVSDSFFVWRFDCDFTTDNPVAADAIMKLAGTSQD